MTRLTLDAPRTWPDIGASAETLDEVSRMRAAATPDALAYAFFRDHEEITERISYAELDLRARGLAAALQVQARQGDRVLLLVHAGIDYVVAFFACLYAGTVPVPAYPPRRGPTVERLRRIAEDCGARIALAGTAPDGDVLRHLGTAGDLVWMTPEAAIGPDDWQRPVTDPSAVALLQYTSGSTAEPKGVIVTHANLMANQAMIAQSMGHHSNSTFVSWLPVYHDMGLIGNLLQPLYLGTPCYFMPPAAFLQMPIRWLRAVSEFRAHTSGAPNFAYDLCVERTTQAQRDGLDLACWRVAYNGSEVVNARTMERFARAFAPHGFRRQALYPCYGLAEATLFVSGGARDVVLQTVTLDRKALARDQVQPAQAQDSDAVKQVSCGRVAQDLDLRIVDPENRRPQSDGSVGEIWLRGPSVAAGYWNARDATEATFCARIAGEADAQNWFRTGDLGFVQDGELFVTGRLKDLIVIRGRNHYPQDIEATVATCHPAFSPGGSAAVGLGESGDGGLAVLAEVDRRYFRTMDGDALIAAIRAAIAEEHGLALDAVALLRPGALPRTTSGKIRHAHCRTLLSDPPRAVAQLWRADATASPTPEPEVPAREAGAVADWLAARVANVLSIPIEQIDRNVPIGRHGLDSIAAVSLCHRIETAFGTLLTPATLFEKDANGLAATIVADSAEPKFEDAVASVEDGNPFPLTDGQKALWFLDMIAPDDPGRHIARALRIRSSVDYERLKSAFQALVDRHPMLRASVRTTDGQQEQIVRPSAEVAFAVQSANTLDEEAFEARLRSEAFRPFDLENGPLFRITLFRRTSGADVLLISIHHIVADLWSLGVLLDELRELLAAAEEGRPPQLPVVSGSFAHHVAREANLLNGPAGAALLSYWREHVGGALSPPILPGSVTQTVLRKRAGRRRFTVERDLAQALRALCYAQGTTLYTLCLTALEALIFQQTGRDGFVLGTLTAGRERADGARLVGYLANIVALRATLSRNERFSALLRRVHGHVLGALAHQRFPFPRLVEALRPARSAERVQQLRVLLVFQRAHIAGDDDLTRLALDEPGARLDWGGLLLELIELPPPKAQFDVTVTLAELDGEIRGLVEYDASRYDAATIDGLIAGYKSILSTVGEDPDTPVGLLPTGEGGAA
jgi:acyl-CoA synthetase (AMP-forming)/AMP-acid ligase II